MFSPSCVKKLRPYSLSSSAPRTALAAVVSIVMAVAARTSAQEAAAPAITPENLSSPSGVRSDLLVNTSWLETNLNRPDLVILQIGKNDKAYKEGHVPGARYVDWKEMTVDKPGVPNELPPMEQLVKWIQLAGIDEKSRIVLYDDETGILAARAYVTLDYLGLGDRASLLDGQWKRWFAEKRAVSTKVPEVKATTFVPTPRPGVIAPLSLVAGLSWQKSTDAEAPVAIVDARPATQFVGEEPGEDIARGGHIPGAVNVHSAKNLMDENDPTFKAPADLLALYEGAGIRKDDRVVTYCRTGAQGSMAYFALKYLGYDPLLYDGSFTEWSGRRDTTVIGPDGAPVPPPAGGSVATPAPTPKPTLRPTPRPTTTPRPPLTDQ